MGRWEKRLRGGKYYTRSKKIQGRVIREYIGNGPEAERVAAEDAERRAHRKAERCRRQSLESIDQEISNLYTTIEILIKAHLLLKGYRQHNRGEWRKSRKVTPS